MTAAEKLRTLDEAMVETPWPDKLRATVGNRITTLHIEEEDALALIVIRNALPAIIAVLKAVEGGYTVETEDGESFEVCAVCHRTIWRGHADDCALTALSQALDGES